MRLITRNNASLYIASIFNCKHESPREADKKKEAESLTQPPILGIILNLTGFYYFKPKDFSASLSTWP